MTKRPLIPPTVDGHTAPTGADPRHDGVPAPQSAGGLRIERVIMHALDHRAQSPTLVDQVVLLDESTAAYFASYLATATERAEWDARFMDPAGPAATLCQRLFEPVEFVGASRELAQMLFEQMRLGGRVISPGDFAVLSYCQAQARDDEPCLALLKLDMEQHHLRRHYMTRDGVTTVRIGVANDVLPDTRDLQKCALLRRSGRELSVTLLDSQAGPASEGVAAFFYSGFLGTHLAPSPRRHTRAFLRVTDGWLARNAGRLTPRQTLTFFGARRSALAQDRVELAPFVRAALPEHPGLHADLLATLRQEIFVAEGEKAPQSFLVDTRSVRLFLRQVRLLLDGGVQVSVPASRFDDMVRVLDERTPDGTWRFILESLNVSEATQ